MAEIDVKGLVERFTPTNAWNAAGAPRGAMLKAAEGEWVRFTDYQRALASEKTRADGLETTIEQVRLDFQEQLGRAEALLCDNIDLASENARLESELAKLQNRLIAR